MIELQVRNMCFVMVMTKYNHTLTCILEMKHLYIHNIMVWFGFTLTLCCIFLVPNILYLPPVYIIEKQINRQHFYVTQFKIHFSSP